MEFFIVGWGITTMTGAAAQVLSKELGSMGGIIVFAVNLVISGIFASFGYLARQGKNWSFILVMGLYTLDGLLFLLILDYLSRGFHALALGGIYFGLRASKKLAALEPA